MASATKATDATATKEARAPGLELRVARLAIEVDPAGAAREARGIVARLEAQTSPTAERPAGFGVPEARRAFEAIAVARARLALIEDLVAGKTPPAWGGDPDPVAVASDTIRWWGEHNGVA